MASGNGGKGGKKSGGTAAGQRQLKLTAQAEKAVKSGKSTSYSPYDSSIPF
jgi:hypothetical protein